CGTNSAPWFWLPPNVSTAASDQAPSYKSTGSNFESSVKDYASSCQPASFADARQEGRRITDRRNLDLRAEVGWVSCPGVSRWRRDFAPESRRKVAKPLLSGTARAPPLAVAHSLRA